MIENQKNMDMLLKELESVVIFLNKVLAGQCEWKGRIISLIKRSWKYIWLQYTIDASTNNRKGWW